MIKHLIKKVFEKAGYTLKKTAFLEHNYHFHTDPRYRKSGDFNPLEQLIYKYIDDDFFFIQIGANNGKRYDPLNHLITREKEFISGIAIEPVQEYFSELQLTYEDFSNIKLLRKAIHNTNKECTIYKVNPTKEGLEEHLKGMSSFDITNLTKDGVLESDIIPETVPCLSFMDLIRTENISKLHLLQIDAEGYDIEIINSIDFSIIKPKIINFEHRWQYGLVSNNELFKIFHTLILHGYTIVLNGNDALAYSY